MRGSTTSLRILSIVGVILIIALPCYGAHPLITDDTGTQGRGKFQVEVNSELASDAETQGGVRIEEKAAALSTILSCGISDNADIVVGLPLVSSKVTEGGTSVADESGISDASLEFKWRFHEAGGTSLALKPGITIPTGDEEKGLGTGKYGFGLFLIGTREPGLWTLHVNLGYVRNNNHTDERVDLWHLSFASEWKASESATIVGNIGIEKNTDKAAEDPAFILAGVIYALSEDLDVDFGVKAGVTDAEMDQTLLAGLAWRF